MTRYKDWITKDTKYNIQVIDSLLSKEERIILALHDRNFLSDLGYYIDYIDDVYIWIYPQHELGWDYKFIISEIPDSFYCIQKFIYENLIK